MSQPFKWKEIKTVAKDKLIESGKLLLKSFAPIEQPVNLNKKAFQKLYERYGLAPFLPYRHFDGSGVWIDDDEDRFGSYLMLFEVNPIIRAGEDTNDAIAEMIKSPDFPTGTIFYSFVEANNDIEPYMAAYCISQKQNHDEMYRKLANYRTNFMTSFAKGEINPFRVSGFKPRTMRYYLAVKVPTPKGTFNQEKAQDFEETLRRVEQQIINVEKNANIGCKRLTGVQVVKKLDQLINPAVDFPDIQSTSYDEQPLNQLLARKESDINIQDDGVICFRNNLTNRKRFAKALSVIKFGKKGEPYDMSSTGDATGKTYKSDHYLPETFMAYTIIEKLDEQKTETGLNAKILKGNEGKKWIEGETMAFFMRDQIEVGNEVKALHKQIVDDHYGAAKVSSGVIIYSDNEKDLNLAVSKAATLYKESGLTLYQESSIAMPVWLTSLTGYFHPDMDGVEKGLCRATTFNAYNAASLLHVQGDWRGVNPLKGGILSFCRKGELACLSLFDVFKSNYNFLLAADSGSGKSFLINELAKSARSTGGKIRIIDMGRSYEQSCETMGGKNIIFEKDSNLCLNFFSEIFTKDDYDESRETLISLVASMCFPKAYAGNVEFSDAFQFQLDVLGHAIDETWETLGSEMSILDVYQWIVAAFEGSLQNKTPEANAYKADQRVKDMFVALRKWAKGSYSRWFVGKCNLNFDNDFIVLELDELKSQPDLQTVVMNYIIARIEHEVYIGWKENKESMTRKQTYVIIDEAWSALAQENTSAFMEEAARRFRKYEACMGIASQSFLDVDNNSAGKSYARNCNHIIALKTNVKNVEEAAEKGIIELAPHQSKWIKSLEKTNDYSEFFWINKSKKAEGLYRFIVDPVTAYIYSSTGEDRDMIKSLMNKGYSLMDAIEKLANDKVDLELWASARLDKKIKALKNIKEVA